MALTRKHLTGVLGLALGLVMLAACETHIPSLDTIRDSKLVDRRISETPRQKVIRECQQEGSRFRVACTHCHTTEKVEGITADNPVLTPVGERAQIMRTSPTFGQHQDCAQCHLTKFALNRKAEKDFGAGGAKYRESLSELKIDK